MVEYAGPLPLRKPLVWQPQEVSAEAVLVVGSNINCDVAGSVRIQNQHQRLD